jgi:16S rRNA C967 or C1407 C5-methylase (RsmB/RsmF family)
MVRRLETPTGALRLTPHSANTDGFFVAVLRKTG